MKYFDDQTVQRRSNEIGASLVQYIIALAIMLVVFIAASQYLENARALRAASSTEVGADFVPCNKDLSAEQCY